MEKASKKKLAKVVSFETEQVQHLKREGYNPHPELVKSFINQNGQIWNKVCVTDPEFISPASFGRKFLSIVAQYLLRQATELWGPYGHQWGVRDNNTEYIRDHENKIIMAQFSAVFFYPVEDKEASFPMSVSLQFKGKNLESLHKKLLTDFTSKALSKLGFAADVFLGLYDKSNPAGSIALMDNPSANALEPIDDKKEKRRLSDNAFAKLIEKIKQKLSTMKTADDLKHFVKPYEDLYVWSNEQADQLNSIMNDIISNQHGH